MPLETEVRKLLFKLADLKPEVVLGPQQTRVAEKVKALPPNTGMLVYHGLGSGKTLASIAAAEGIGGKKTVVVPAALRENYKKDLTKFRGEGEDYGITSYSKAVRTGAVDPGDITVFDEAHRMGRPESALSKLPEMAAGKKVLLTGTPVRNDPSEIVPLLKAIAPDRAVPKTKEEFEQQFIEYKPRQQGWVDWIRGIDPGVEPTLKNTGVLKQLMAGRVDYHPSSGEFPNKHEQDIEVNMSSPQTDLYRGLMATDPTLEYKVRHNLPPTKAEAIRLNSFLNAVRQVSNNPASYSTAFGGDPFEHSPKLQRMHHEINKHMSADPNFRGVVYSNYLDSGIKPLASKLSAAGISNAVFTGEIGDKERRKMVEAYNQGKIKVLLISGAGAEGLDLKGTKLVQVMEPHWNNARIDQVVGRAVRHKSHAHLPENERHVKVQRFYAVPAQGWMERLGLADPDIGSDRYMQNRSSEKQHLVDQLLQVMRDAGTPRKAVR
jgi:SNF2 family DNA or RNA helicase